MPRNDFLAAIEAANGDPFLMAVVQLESKSATAKAKEESRRALLGASVPHWFDQELLGEILGFPESLEMTWSALSRASFIERFVARGDEALNVHEETRRAAMSYLVKFDRALLEKHSDLIANRDFGEETSAIRAERLYHLFLSNPGLAVKKLEDSYQELIWSAEPDEGTLVANNCRELLSLGVLAAQAELQLTLFVLEQEASANGYSSSYKAAEALLDSLDDGEKSARSRLQLLVGYGAVEQGNVAVAQTALRNVVESSATGNADGLEARIKNLALLELGRLESSEGLGAHAVDTLKEAVRGFEALLNHRDCDFHRRQLAISLQELGLAQCRAGRVKDGLTSLLQDLSISEELHDSDPWNSRFAYDLAVSESCVAITKHEDGADSEECLAHIYRAKELAASAMTLGDPVLTTTRELAIFEIQHSTILFDAGQFEDGLVVSEESVRLFQHLVELDPNSLSWCRDLAVALEWRGEHLLKLGRAADYLRDLDERISIYNEIIAAGGLLPSWAVERDRAVEARRAYSHPQQSSAVIDVAEDQ